MHIALIGATGRIGGSILEELLRRGHRVTGISRHPERTPSKPELHALGGDITQPEALGAALNGHDAVISAVPFLPGSSALLIDGVRRSGVKRLIVVGGAGSLNAGDGKILADVMEAPAEWIPMIREGVAFLNLLRAESLLDWTFICPPALIGAGERRGTYRKGSDQLVVDAEGKSHISYDDYAIALVDELERPAHMRARFTVGN
jgi:putative NADH-flavin reductase